MKTEWFPVVINPVRAGVYQVEKSYGVIWAHWNGRAWSHGHIARPGPTSEFIHNRYAYPIKRWRGLNYDPY